MLAVFALLLVPGQAMAQDSVTDGYGGTGDVLNEVVSGGGGGGSDDASGSAPATTESGASAPTTASGGSLPFTGLDVGLLIGGGLGMLLLGVALRRVSRTSN